MAPILSLAIVGAYRRIEPIVLKRTATPCDDSVTGIEQERVVSGIAGVTLFSLVEHDELGSRCAMMGNAPVAVELS